MARSAVELDNLNIGSPNATVEQPVAQHGGLDDIPRQDFSLPPVDTGKDAWLFLAACWMVEALVVSHPHGINCL